MEIVLIICSISPFGKKKGGSVRKYEFIRALSIGIERHRKIQGDAKLLTWIIKIDPAKESQRGKRNAPKWCAVRKHGKCRWVLQQRWAFEMLEPYALKGANSVLREWGQ